MQDPAPALERSAFKHVVVPLGVVIGMGVAHIVTSLSKYVDNRRNLRFGFAHGIWTLIWLIWFVGLWWILWRCRLVEAERWSFASLILLLVGPAALYLAVSLLLPVPHLGEPLDLAARFDQVARPFFVCLCGVVLWLGVTEVALLGEPLAHRHRFGQGLAGLLLAAGAAFPSRRNASVLGALMLMLATFTFVSTRGELA